MSTVYIGINNISDTQTKIMMFISDWVHEKKTPVPLREIKQAMLDKGVKTPTVVRAIGVLLEKQYIRRAVTISNKSYFVMLKTI